MRLPGLKATFLIAGLLALIAVPAAADPIFGPSTYERTTGPSDVYTEVFTAPATGYYALWVQNGDDTGGQVSSGSITVNGIEVVKESDFSRQVELIRKPLRLVTGEHTLVITLNGEPGSFITVAILPANERPNVTVGRLLLPHASAQSLVVDLKNGSHGHGRWVRVVFFDDAGNCVASSGRLFLGPRASFSQPVSSLIVNGSWTDGSIEVFYGGRGYGRVFGQAVPTDATTGIGSIVPLQHAGHRHYPKR